MLIGPSTFNFARSHPPGPGRGAARQVADADELHRTVATLLADPDTRQRMGAAQAAAQRHRGATARTLAHLLGVWGGCGLRVTRGARAHAELAGAPGQQGRATTPDSVASGVYSQGRSHGPSDVLQLIWPILHSPLRGKRPDIERHQHQIYPQPAAHRDCQAA